MKTILFFLGISCSFWANAQKHFELGGHLGGNLSAVAWDGLADWGTKYEYTAKTARYGIVAKYYLGNHVAIRLELNRETRGWNSPFKYLDTLRGYVEDITDYRYYFWIAPIMIDFSLGRKKGIYASLGFAPMLQTKGTKTIRSTGENETIKIHEPFRANGIYQYAGLANIGYTYPIYGNFYLYGETRFNLSFNYFEPKRKGYHYAYGAIMGVTYRL
ncbi:MAG: hypothetical protein RL329_3806 [Bacteroidota bacterium]|jgi:hypothetical protein